MKRIMKLSVLVLALLVLAGLLLAVSSATASGVDGGGGYCNPLYLKLGGCEPPVTCNLGRPIVDYDNYTQTYVLKCQQDPQAPEAGGNLLPGQRLKFECPTPIYTIPVGENIVIVGCHD